MEAAFCKAARVTFFGSTTPALTRSSYSLVATLYPSLPLRRLTSCDHDGAFHAGVVRQRAGRILDGALDDIDADALVFVLQA